MCPSKNNEFQGDISDLVGIIGGQEISQVTLKGPLRQKVGVNNNKPFFGVFFSVLKQHEY